VKENHTNKDSLMSRGKFLKMGIGLTLGAAVFGIFGCKEQEALGNHPVPMAQAINFVGDTRYKTYHRMTCRSKPQGNNAVFFDSPVGAHHHGYRPCRFCRPDQF
jgi:hypothetical protein